MQKLLILLIIIALIPISIGFIFDLGYETQMTMTKISGAIFFIGAIIGGIAVLFKNNNNDDSNDKS